MKDCYDGSVEKTFEKNEFTIGDMVYLTAFVRDNTAAGPGYQIKISGPNNIVYTWTLDPFNTYYDWAYFYYNYSSDVFNVAGTWKFEVTFGTSKSETVFTMKDPLPLDLLSFSAKMNDENVLLNWQTAAETNTAHFEIEHGTDADHFEMIGKVATVGNDRSGKNDYSFNDYNPTQGVNFYRLRMVDKDGKFTYSKVEKVNVTKMNSVRVFPNPATNIVTLTGVKQYNRVRISNLQGSEVLSRTFEGDELKLNIAHLPAGVYLLQLGKDVFEYNVKLIKK